MSFKVPVKDNCHPGSKISIKNHPSEIIGANVKKGKGNGGTVVGDKTNFQPIPGGHGLSGYAKHGK